MFISDLCKQYTIETDDSWFDKIKPSTSGYEARHDQPLGSGVGVTTFPQELLWPEETWKERIQELEAKKMRISDLIKRTPEFKCLNQNPTNYCWCYAVVHAVMIARLLANEPFIRLSPYSVATIIKQGRNQGGWGSQALEFIVQNGISDEKYFPQQPIMSNMDVIRNWQQYVAPSRENAARHKVTEFWDLKPRNWHEKISCLLIPLPVASGYNHMGHERCSTDAVVLPNGDTGCLDLDSYTRDGSFDGKILGSRLGAADDQVVPRVLTPSDT